MERKQQYEMKRKVLTWSMVLLWVEILCLGYASAAAGVDIVKNGNGSEVAHEESNSTAFIHPAVRPHARDRRVLGSFFEITDEDDKPNKTRTARQTFSYDTFSNAETECLTRFFRGSQNILCSGPEASYDPKICTPKQLNKERFAFRGFKGMMCKDLFPGGE